MRSLGIELGQDVPAGIQSVKELLHSLAGCLKALGNRQQSSDEQLQLVAVNGTLHAAVASTVRVMDLAASGPEAAGLRQYATGEHSGCGLQRHACAHAHVLEWQRQGCYS
jgi:hypothetical protein